MKFISIEYDCAHNSPNGICIFISIETNTNGTPALSVLTARQQICVPLQRSELLTCCCVYQMLFIKISTDYNRTNLTDSTHVNFSQLEHFVSTRFIILFRETLYNSIFSGHMFFENPPKL